MDKADNIIQKMSINELREGMVLGRDVLNTWGAVLLPQGAALTSENFSRLTLNNIRFLFIKSSSIDYSKRHFMGGMGGMPELIVEKIEDKPEFKAFKKEYDNKTQVLKAALIDIGNGGSVKVDTIVNITTDTMSKLNYKSDLLSYLACLSSSDEHTYTHSNNVSLLCNLFASWLNLSDEDTINLTAAGLLHDVGKTRIEPSILNKKEPLTAEEFNIIMHHCVMGYEILKEQNIPNEIILAALTHHEKIDGTGYPFGLKGQRISRFGRMLAICDIYDAMTSNRVYRSRICPFHVIREFENNSYGELDTEFLLSFLQNIAYTYVGSYVGLSDGRQGQIVYINKLDLSRPMVRVDDTVINLSEQRDIIISKIL